MRINRAEIESLKPYCETDEQLRTLEVYLQEGTIPKAGIKIGIAGRNVQARIDRIRMQAAKAGWSADSQVSRSPEHGFHLKGKSLFVDNTTGDTIRTWYKYDANKDDNLRAVLEATESAISSYKPLKKIPSPKRANKDLLTVYPMGDPHIGLYAWANETGEDFDCDIAEKNLREAVAYLVDKSPNSETAIILNLGDFFHSDNQSNRTARAGNALDVDTRWSRVLQIGVSLMIDCVNLALTKHKKVIVKNNIGNHDDHTSQVLSVVMSHVFKNNPRVHIEPAEKPFFWYQFGKVMIGSTHGHMVKPKDAAKVAADYQAKMWGDTEHRYFYFGHFHHENRTEDGGIITEIFNTLAASDAWHHASGYRAKRNMKSIVLHRDEGEVERYTFSISRKA